MALCPHKSTDSGVRSHTETRYSHYISLHPWNALAIFFLSITNPAAVYITSFPHPDLVQLHLSLDHTKFTQNRPPLESDIVGLFDYQKKKCQQLTYIHPSCFAHVGEFSY